MLFAVSPPKNAIHTDTETLTDLRSIARMNMLHSPVAVNMHPIQKKTTVDFVFVLVGDRNSHATVSPLVCYGTRVCVESLKRIHCEHVVSVSIRFAALLNSLMFCHTQSGIALYFVALRSATVYSCFLLFEREISTFFDANRCDFNC